MKQKIDYVILPAVVSDADAIAELEQANFSEPWSVNQIIEEITKHNTIFLVSKCENRTCGYVSGQLILDEFYMSNIAVSSDFRGYGIATELLNNLTKNVKLKNASFITLEVRESNDIARKLYEKIGFVNQGIRKNFYTQPRENACIYTLFF